MEDIVFEMKGVASTFIAGVTYGNRVIKGIIFKAGSPTRGAFIDCGIHAVSFSN